MVQRALSSLLLAPVHVSVPFLKTLRAAYLTESTHSVCLSLQEGVD